MAMASKPAGAVHKPTPPVNACTTTGQKPRPNRHKHQSDDIVFIDMDSDRASTVSAAKIHQISAKDILLQNQETSPEAVYEIILRTEKYTKIQNLDSFKKCRSLDLSSNKIKNIENLSSLRDLRELKLYDNEITEIKNLEMLMELNNLQLQYNHIGTIGLGLAKLKKLKQLRLANNQIMEIKVKELTSCFALTSLDLSYNQIQDITPVNCLPNLEELRVSNNKLKQVQDLTRCRKLEEIDLSGNKLVDVSGLKGLPCLNTLDLSKNLLASIASTGTLKNLRDLNLSDNKFRDTTRLITAFLELENLKLNNNRIEDWNEFLKFRNCENLVELYIDGNPAYDNEENHVTANQQLSAAIPQLDILNGAVIHRKTRSSAPLMRPMSANSIISVKQVEHQIRAIETEMNTFETDFTSKFDSMTSSLTSLPAHGPGSNENKTESPRPLTASRQSRCGSRSKLREAMTFASTNFESL